MRAMTGILMAVGCALATAGAASAAPPPGATWEEAWVTSADGTLLHADVMHPEGLARDARRPVILIAGPYFGLSESGPFPDEDPPRVEPNYGDFYERAFARGYSVVQLTVRGYGASGGCWDYEGPGERADVVAGIRWAAAQPWSTGRVGTYGGSYDGFTQVAALASRVPGHAAAVIASGVSDPYRVHYMNRVAYFGRSAAIPAEYLGYQALPGPPAGSQEAALQAAVSGAPCAADTFLQTQDPDPQSAFWRARDLVEAASGSRVPTLWAHGLVDLQVKPDQFHEVFAALRGPKRLWLAQTGHVPTRLWQEEAGRGATFIEEAFRWFDHHLKDARAPQDPPAVIQEGARGRWRAERRWPPPGARPYVLPLRPGTYTDGPGNKAEPSPGCSVTTLDPRCGPAAAQGVGTWTFSPPLAHDAHLSGVPRLRVEVAHLATEVNVIALLYDVDEHGQAVLLDRGAARSRGSGSVHFDLYPQDWELRRGHRLGLLLTGSDEYYFDSGRSGTPVSVGHGELELPFLRDARGSALDGGPSRWIRERPSFAVDPGPATVEWEAPPPMRARPRLSLTVRPHRGRTGRRTRFRFQVRSGGAPVAGATVSFDGRARRTGRSGRAALVVRAARRGRRVAVAERDGFEPARRVVLFG